MVSIPNSQIKNIIYFDINKQLSPSKTAAQKWNDNIFQKAENDGYFTKVTAEYLNKRFNSKFKSKRKSEKDQINDLVKLSMIILNGARIKNLMCIEYCRNLVYLNLTHNFISDISPLKHCQNLLYLDLSENTITNLPGPQFWCSGPSQLIILLLNGNSIGNPELVSGLRTAPNLQIITLFDTPLSLRPRYRHFIVNSVWTLKLLDQHFVSDEEIIEDMNFPIKSRYRSMSNFIRYQGSIQCPNLIIDGIIQQNNNIIKKEIQKLLSDINRHYSHASPVIIIQRYIRGFICRKRLKEVSKKLSKNTIQISTGTQEVVPIIETKKEMTIDNEKELEKSKIEKKHLQINLQQLNQHSTIETLDKEARYMDSMQLLPGARFMMTYRSVSKSDIDKCSPEHISRALAKSHSAFSKDDIDITPVEEAQFRLKGYKPPRAKHPISELIIEKNRSHYLIREADRLYHDTKLLSPLEPLKKLSSETNKHNNFDILKKRMEISEALAELRKTNTKQTENIRAAILEHNLNRVEVIKREEGFMKQSLAETRTDRIVGAKLAEEEHKKIVKEAEEKEKEEIVRIYDEIQHRRAKSLDRRAHISKQLNFSFGFGSRQNMAVNTIVKYERQTMNADKLKIAKNSVEDAKNELQYKTEFVKEYLRDLAKEKSAIRQEQRRNIDFNLLTMANENLEAARRHVERQKSFIRQVTCPTLPVVVPQLKQEQVDT